jgi:hypothetical protein
MFVTTKIVFSSTYEVLEHEGYEYEGPVARCCDASKQQTGAAATQQSLMNQMTGQMTQVFGNDNQVFNNLMASVQQTVAAGPGQQGFSQAELNAMNSQAITNNANQYKNVSGAVKSGEAAQGGGNSVSNAGATIGLNTGIAEQAAANTANSLNQITQANYATGRQNYQNAVATEQGLTNSFNNLSSLENSAQAGTEANYKNQAAIGSQNQWLTKDISSLAMSGVSAMASGGVDSLGTLASQQGSGNIGW